MSTQNSTTPLLLAAWSVTTPAYIRYANVAYTDTPRSRYESQRRAFAAKAVAK